MASNPFERASSGRSQWQSRAGFILAAAGAAIGLGNIWKFPFITGQNGGGLFVLIYLACIALVGLPVMVSEIIIGRAAQKSPVAAYNGLSGGKTIWSLVGWGGVTAGFILLSYYSVVAGWSMNYIGLALQDSFTGRDPKEITGLFVGLVQDLPRSILWHGVFMGLTTAIVLIGVRRGIETGVRIMMPLLLVFMVGLMVYAGTLPSFTTALDFVFSPHSDRLTAGGVLEALGHSFFTLSVGLGGLITYGSYLNRNDDIVAASTAITVLDTFVALVACLVMFPFLFAVGAEPTNGPPLIFIAMPIAFSQIPGGALWGIVFFGLLFFAALTSAISLLEVVVSTLIDQLKIGRKLATVVSGGGIFLYGILSAKSDLQIPGIEATGPDFLQQMDFFVSNVFLPLGGLAITIFAGWVIPRSTSYEEFNSAKQRDRLYRGWLFLVRYVVPLAIVTIFLYSVLHNLQL